MKHSKKKKSLLALASSLVPVATALLSNGRYVHGGLVSLVTVGSFIAYDYFDDKAKGQTQLPAEIDAELIEQITGDLSEQINEQRDDR